MPLSAKAITAPIATPIASGRNSRTHSGQPATARRVARIAETWPRPNQMAALANVAIV